MENREEIETGRGKQGEIETWGDRNRKDIFF